MISMMTSTFLSALSFSGLLLGVAPAETSSPPTAPAIVLDGRFEDWAGLPVVLTDPADAVDAAVDFGMIAVTHTDQFVHLFIEFRRVVNLQRLEGTATLLLDVDGNAATGVTEHGMAGVDLAIDFTPPNARNPGQPGMGVGVRALGVERQPKLNGYSLDMAFAPTSASDRFEITLGRHIDLEVVPRLFAGESFTGKLIFIDLAGQLRDETEVFSHVLSPTAPTHPLAQDRPLDRHADADLRVMTWNIEQNRILDRADIFGRVAAALNPDVIFFQELQDSKDRNVPEALLAFLNQHMPGTVEKPASWSLVFGKGGGNLRSAVASRLPMTPSSALELVADPQSPRNSVRVAAGVVQSGERRLLAVAVHLKCCGGINTPEDEKRMLEVQAIRAALIPEFERERYDGIIIAGDYNLVGSDLPLLLMAEGLDADRTRLEAADAYQLDGLSNATWFDPNQPFLPGRLDYALFSDAALTLKHAFVFDSRDLHQQWLEHYKLLGSESLQTADHLPVVIDLQWKRR